MPDEVVLVTTGEYADRRVIAVAEDEETAQRYADRWTLDSFGVEASGYGRRAEAGERVPFVRTGDVR
jgi:hypothetical protein